MLKQLMEQRGLDAHGVIIKATEAMIDKTSRKSLDKYGMSGDKMIRHFRNSNDKYKQLTDEYITLHGYAY